MKFSRGVFGASSFSSHSLKFPTQLRILSRPLSLSNPSMPDATNKPELVRTNEWRPLQSSTNHGKCEGEADGHPSSREKGENEEEQIEKEFSRHLAQEPSGWLENLKLGQRNILLTATLSTFLRPELPFLLGE